MAITIDIPDEHAVTVLTALLDMLESASRMLFDELQAGASGGHTEVEKILLHADEITSLAYVIREITTVRGQAEVLR